MASAVITHRQNAALPGVLRFWHVASLDAPTVAIVWAAAAARTLNVHLPALVCAALFAAVWTIYVADRLLDSGIDGECHEFHRRHKAGFIGALIAVWLSLGFAFALFRENAADICFRAECFLLPPLIVYFRLEHATITHVRRGWQHAKHLIIAVLFAAGCVVPALVLSHGRLPVALAAFAALAALAWFNLRVTSSQASIARPDNKFVKTSAAIQWLKPGFLARSNARAQSPRLLHKIKSATHQPVLAGASVGAIVLLCAPGGIFWISLVLAAVGLFLLENNRRISTLERRILADLFLLLPAVTLVRM